jgi:PilZ domain
MGNERRRATRHAAQLPAEIELGQGDVRNAITADGSVSGLLLLAQGKLEPGQTVTIRCFTGEGGEVLVVQGTVVRQETLSTEDYSLYRSRVAVQMSAPNPELAERFEALEGPKSPKR